MLPPLLSPSLRAFAPPSTVVGANGNVGPPRYRVGTPTYIAGFIRNSPENMAMWIEDPQKALPGNAMPAMRISDKDAHDITAFLYTLK
ncbi:MAG: c-type cytochrome [Gemmatimonas sp.]